jgi:CheY-like chemotaxis protein
VLVAEDNPINQAILRDQLEQLGCRAVVASDGNEALGYWQQGAFALVLTDLNMPGLDGYGLARALRARGVSVPIHGATANADPAERQRCQESGMQGVLVKPITLEALQRLLTRITQGDAPAADAGAPCIHRYATMIRRCRFPRRCRHCSCRPCRPTWTACARRSPPPIPPRGAGTASHPRRTGHRRRTCAGGQRPADRTVPCRRR